MPAAGPAHRRVAGRVAALLGALVAITSAGCSVEPRGATTTTGAGSGRAATNTPSPTSTPSPTPTVDVVAQARTQAAQHDYDAAIRTLAAATTPQARAELARVQALKAKAVRWPDNTTIPHLFYHSAAVDPRRAFAAPGSEAVGFSQYMTSVGELRKQLEQMHARGWVLVHPQRIAARGADGIMRPQPILLPPGKKPVVLSLDDLSYYEYMVGKGFANVLVAKPDGRVVNTYTDVAGRTVEGSFDCPPIIDDFVREHPDFSYRGDKGSIAMTGYNGVLGYRTSIRTYGDTPATRAAQAEATVVAAAMKRNGWQFASHSWGHINMTRSDLGRIKADAARWDAEVRPILGDTPLMIYPFGADIGDASPYSPGNPKFAFLHGTEKFDYFFGVDGTTPHWVQLSGQVFRQSRANVDGISLQRALDGRRTAITQFFDARPTMDPARPLPVPSVGGPRAGG
ncbi:polysaccharide deacetylase family protein [Arsenicicoccus dermatophilus]|uniref:polysaccharide deacetylase family protein n=1 Tax=Arsenicicoccus dermatophilus TaxID=1076331 RepID=UPI001F4D009E|nr:polysaccharide deacetylase family protein [Arsenicicoccus dermatophilus]MCH8614152.1 polysaccharide deacetylase [Arsenicicoccus dermatophilus]